MILVGDHTSAVHLIGESSEAPVLFYVIFKKVDYGKKII
jgi:hypothetical protein